MTRQPDRGSQDFGNQFRLLVHANVLEHPLEIHPRRLGRDAQAVRGLFEGGPGHEQLAEARLRSGETEEALQELCGGFRRLLGDR